tara:strand:- start:50 stop:304 length:255 start_codon:yes stop_codon:yes gene_type:complete
MKSKNEILGILGKIEANVQLGQNKLDLIEGHPDYQWEVNSLKNNLARIKELIEDITKEEEPEKSEAREAMETGDWGKFFDTFTK